MITISRAFDPTKGLQSIENLSGYTFSAESYAHRFIISTAEGFDGAVSARLLRSDNITVFVSGSVSETDGSAIVDLPPECYAVPGRFFLAIYVTAASVKTCVYAGIGTVYRSESDTTIAGDGSLVPLETSIAELLARYATTINNANLVAAFAQNIGDVEGDIDTFQGSVDDLQSEFDNVLTALAAQDFRTLNGPNLLPYQPEGVECAVPSGTVITETITIPAEDAAAAAEALTYTVTNENITAGMVLHGMKSSNTGVVYWGMVTGTASAGSMAVTVAARPNGAHEGSVTVTLYICATTTAMLPYGEEARHYWSGRPYINSSTNPIYTGDPGEEISERIVTLTGNDIVTDDDGASYNKAVAFTVSQVPASGQNNMDVLCFNYGNGRYKTTAAYNAQTMGDIPEMTVGEKYTLSCWARVTNGIGARLALIWGNTAYSATANYGGKKYVDITGATWQRVWWTFVFNPTAPSQYYTYTDGNNDTWYSAYWQKHVGFGVCRAYAGTVQLTGFRLVHGGLMGDNTVDTLALDVQQAQDDVEALDADVTALETSVANIMANITPNVETAMTATANYAAGDVIAVGAKLYQATAAITTGATLAVGTNVAAITLVDYIAQLTSGS